MRITLMTLAFGEVPYLRYTEAINREYCARHGYRFEIVRPHYEPGRSPIWQKVKGVRDLLSASDYVLFLDADAYVHDQTRRVEDLIAEHMGDAVMLIGTDRRDKDFAWSDDNGNCGVFLFQNSPMAFQILDEWWNVPVRGVASRQWWRKRDKLRRQQKIWLWRWPAEQGPFNAYVRLGAYRRWIRTIYYAHLNGVDGTFIRHLIGFTDERRLCILRALRPDLTASGSGTPSATVSRLNEKPRIGDGIMAK